VKLIPLAGFDPDTLKPLSPAQLARREHIAAEMARVAKASEAELAADERRQVIDLAELREMAYECAVIAPFAALATVAWFAVNIP
jgi:hypothetical protein